MNENTLKTDLELSANLNPSLIDSPTKLLAIIFCGIILLNGGYIFAAYKGLLPYLLSISAISLVSLFILVSFILIIVFRRNLQSDQYYSKLEIKNFKKLENCKILEFSKQNENKDEKELALNIGIGLVACELKAFKFRLKLDNECWKNFVKLYKHSAEFLYEVKLLQRNEIFSDSDDICKIKITELGQKIYNDYKKFLDYEQNDYKKAEN